MFTYMKMIRILEMINLLNLAIFNYLFKIYLIIIIFEQVNIQVKNFNFVKHLFLHFIMKFKLQVFKFILIMD